jgi:hypothetical protein
MTIAALCGGLLLTTNGWPSRFSPQQLAVVAAHNDFSPMRSRCHITKGTPDPKNACTLGETSPKVALWGDSHGVEISLALAEARGSLQTITYSACPPALDWKAPKRGQCSAHNAATYRYLTTTSAITTVYIAAYYKSHIDVPGFSAGFLKAVRGLVAAGKKVIVIGPTPAERDLNLPAYIARTSQTTIPRTVYEKDQAKPIALMDKARLAGAEVFMPAKVMCDETSCNLSIDEKPVLFDNHHLSMAGARYLVSSM